jgi:hypothetical protein
MICGVKSGTFEYDPHRRIYFTECFLIAFRTAGENRVIKTLQAFKSNATILTAIRVNWHLYLYNSLP